MKGSFKIAVILGIPVNIHWTFLLIFVYIYALGSMSSAASSMTLEYMVLILVLFACVLLHEFGHALMARRFGVSTHDIILSPIGGIARLSKLPEKPMQEFLVAIAGPAVNLAIALVLAPFYYLLIPGNDRLSLVNNFFNNNGNYFAPDLSFGGFLIVGLFWLNIVLAIFNLIPAFPMDGGRVLRAGLSLRFPRVAATRYAALIGKIFAGLFILFGLLSQPMNLLYVFIGVFIIITASSELRMVRIEHLMKTKTIRDLLKDRPFRLYQDEAIGIAQEHYKANRQYNFLIYDRWENPIGILPEQEVLRLSKAKDFDPGQAIGRDYLSPMTMTIHESVDLNAAYQAVGGEPHQVAVVFNDGGQAIGVVDRITLNQFLRNGVKRRKN